MPTINPRITVTLTPTLHARLRRLSELTGNSQSALVSDLLDGSGPIFDRTIRVLEAAQDAKEEMKGKLSADLAVAQAKLERQMGLMLDVFDSASGNLLDEVEAIKRRARRSSKGGAVKPTGAAVSTPLSNRGVRSTTKTPKTSTKSRG